VRLSAVIVHESSHEHFPARRAAKFEQHGARYAVTPQMIEGFKRRRDCVSDTHNRMLDAPLKCRTEMWPNRPVVG
jgi:hypothetical protein